MPCRRACEQQARCPKSGIRQTVQSGRVTSVNGKTVDYPSLDRSRRRSACRIGRERGNTLRAAAALNRGTASVQKKARQFGKSFPGVRATKAKIRELEIE